jgi:hypothetical protein
MNALKTFLPAIAVALFATGCLSEMDPNSGRGPDGTVPYRVLVEASDPGARIEVNGKAVATTPAEIIVWGDPDGTFHNFGSSDYVIRVQPVREGQTAQIKVFRTGTILELDDRIPQRLFFDLNLPAPGGYLR